MQYIKFIIFTHIVISNILLLIILVIVLLIVINIYYLLLCHKTPYKQKDILPY